MAEALGVLALLCLLLAAFCLLVYLGWLLAISHLRQQRDVIDQQRKFLNSEWRALDNTRRVREVFLSARRTMQREAQRQYQHGELPEGDR